MIARYFNRTYPNHILYLFVFICALCFALIGVFWNTRPTLAYTLLGLGIACGLLVYYFHRGNHVFEKHILNDSGINKFKSAFTDLRIELDAISGTEKHIPIEILKSHISEIKKAMIDFSNILPETKQVIFKDAWLNLSCEDHEEKKEPPYYNYLLGTSVEIRDRMIDNINELFKFAK